MATDTTYRHEGEKAILLREINDISAGKRALGIVKQTWVVWCRQKGIQSFLPNKLKRRGGQSALRGGAEGRLLGLASIFNFLVADRDFAFLQIQPV